MRLSEMKTQQAVRFPGLYHCLQLVAVLLVYGPRFHYCCFSCLTQPSERMLACETLANHTNTVTAIACLQLLENTFAPLNDYIIPYALKDTIQQAMQFVVTEIQHEKYKHRVGADILRYLINEAKTKADEILTQSNDNWKCKPPCGFQKNARRFYCKTCVEEDCDLPVDCAIHDIDISELDKVDLECTVNYNLPEDKSVTWQFGRNIRSTDLSNFKIIHIGEDTSLLIKPIRSYHRGTYTCQISDDEDVLIRKYFYLNVSRNEYGADTYLEDVFYVVLNTNVTHEEQPPGFKVHSLSDLISLKKSLGLTTRIFLTLGVALLFMLLTLLIGAGYLYATDVE